MAHSWFVAEAIFAREIARIDSRLTVWRWRRCRQARSSFGSLGLAMSWLLGWMKGTNLSG
jgi:hypothetical protein